MFLSDDGSVGGFCCPEFDKATLKPHKTIGFDFLYKRYDNDTPEPKAIIYEMSPSGLATQQSFYSQTGTAAAGHYYSPINFCPYCGEKLEFV